VNAVIENIFAVIGNINDQRVLIFETPDNLFDDKIVVQDGVVPTWDFS